MALRQNPEIQIANLDVAESREDHAVARSALLPQASLGVEEVAVWLGSLTRPELLHRAENARALAKPAAAANMAAIVKEVAK